MEYNKCSESVNVGKLAAISSLHGQIIQLTELMLSLTEEESTLPRRVSGRRDDRTFVHHILAELQDAITYCRRALEQKNIIFTGRSFINTAVVVNRLLQGGLLRWNEYDSTHIVATDVFRIRTREIADEFLDIDSPALRSVLATIGLMPTSATSAGFILPEDENIEQHHIVQRIRFGPDVCVTVNFASNAEMDAVFNHGRAAAFAKNQQRAQTDAYIHALSSRELGSSAATLLSGQTASHSCVRRSLLAKSLFYSKLLPKLHEDLSDASSFIGKSLIYSPGTYLRAHDSVDVAAKVRNFIKQCLSGKHGLWSIITDIVIDIPSNALCNGVEYVIAPELTCLDITQTKCVTNFTSGINTIVYVCDERKMDGDCRHLLKKCLSIDKIIRRSTIRQIYVVVQMDSNASQSPSHFRSVQHRLMRAKESELKSIIKSKLRKHRYSGDTIHNVFLKACKVFGFDEHGEQNGVDTLVEELHNDILRQQKSLPGTYEKVLRRIASICHQLQKYISENITHSRASVCCFVFEQTLATLAHAKIYVQLSGSNLSCAPFVSFLGEWKSTMHMSVEAMLDYWISTFVTNIHEITQIEESLEFTPKRRRIEQNHRAGGFKEAYQFLSRCTHLLQTSEIASSMLRTLQCLNACMLRRLQKTLTVLLCCDGLHPYALSLIKRSIVVKIKECKEVFDTAVTISWLREVCERHFQEELFVEHILSSSVSLVGHLLEGARNELYTCFDSRIRSIHSCYSMIIHSLFCAQGARDFAREIMSGGNFVQHVVGSRQSQGRASTEFRWNQSLDLCLIDQTDIARTVVMDAIHEITQSLCAKNIPSGSLPSQGVNIPPSLTIRFQSICHLDRIVLEGLSFIEREGLKRSSFFKAWGSDILATFLFFREISYGTIRFVCDTMLQHFSKRWLKENSSSPKIETIEDFLFYNEGCYVLRKLGIDHSQLRRQIEQNVHRWSWSEYLSLDHDQMRMKNEKGRFHVHFDKLSTTMIWAFFLSGNGLGIPGTSARDIETLCELSGALDHQAQLASSQFRDKCYFVTHKIFTRSSWCQYSLNTLEWQKEVQFLRYYLPHIVEASDVELVGEFVQALKCLGINESDSDMRSACKFIILSQNKATGGWLSEETPFEIQYHATVCSIGKSTQEF